jgi:hypothetical protein
MGFFKSLGELNRQAKAIEKSQPPMKERMAASTARIQEMTAAMNAGTVANVASMAANAVAGTAQVLAVRDTGMLVNGDPNLGIDLLVTLPGQPPYPVTEQLVVSKVAVARAQPGQMVNVRVNPATPQSVFVDWMTPVA